MYLPHVCECPWKPNENIGFLDTRVTGGCELPDAGVENQIQFLWKALNY